MPRFVLLFHDCPPSYGEPSHWDLMLQRDGVLMTWRLAELPAPWRQPPAEAPPDVLEVNATRLPDHRLAYLDYEGPVSGDRGQVTRIDRGEYILIGELTNELHVDLAGAMAVGKVRLPRKGCS